MNIRIKNLNDNYVIEYNDNSQEFMLLNGATTMKCGKTQKELEGYLERLLKADNKFKTPIKVFGFPYHGIEHGIVTSSNLEDNSFWFVNDKGSRTKVSFRDSDYNGNPSNCGYFEETPKNLGTLAQIIALENNAKALEKQAEDLKKSFENPMTKKFVEAYKESK